MQPVCVVYPVCTARTVIQVNQRLSRGGLDGCARHLTTNGGRVGKAVAVKPRRIGSRHIRRSAGEVVVSQRQQAEFSAVGQAGGDDAGQLVSVQDQVL